jgi:hypothetical protein
MNPPIGRAPVAAPLAMLQSASGLLTFSNLGIETVGSTYIALGKTVCGQYLENPQLVPRPKGGFLLAVIGINPTDATDPQLKRGESLYTFNLGPSGVHTIKARTDPALAFAPSVPPLNWATTGGFGGGVALFVADKPTVSGKRYFAAVNLGNFAQKKFGLAWAASSDGIAWAFEGNAKPEDAQFFVHLTDFGATESIYGGSFWHPAGFYNSADAMFYLFFGMGGAQGIHVQCVRFPFAPDVPFGRVDKMEIWSKGAFIPFSGVFLPSGVNDPLSADFTGDREAIPGALDMQTVCPLHHKDGTPAGFLVVYSPMCRSLFDSAFYYRYSPSQSPALGGASPFPWSDARSIGEGAMANLPLVRTGPGGNPVCLVQGGFQSDERPQILGFFVTAPQACGTGTAQQLATQSNGLLHITLKMW